MHVYSKYSVHLQDADGQEVYNMVPTDSNAFILTQYPAVKDGASFASNHQQNCSVLAISNVLFQDNTAAGAGGAIFSTSPQDFYPFCSGLVSKHTSTPLCMHFPHVASFHAQGTAVVDQVMCPQLEQATTYLPCLCAAIYAYSYKSTCPLGKQTCMLVCSS